MLQTQVRKLLAILLSNYILGSSISLKPILEHRHIEHSSRSLNPRPVIGVLAQECLPQFSQYCRNGTRGYVAASYVKWLEGSGARVLIIPLEFSSKSLARLLKRHLSGVVFPGGSDDTPKYQDRIADIVKLTRGRKISVPVWGTCLGFEALAKLSKIPLTRVNGTARTGLPLNFYTRGDLFKKLPKSLKNAAISEGITYNAHHWAVLQVDAKSSADWRVLTSSYTPEGVEFVSTMEHRKLPIYASQWHPEKAAYEWAHAGEAAFIHNLDAIRLGQYVGNYFLEQARRHRNRYRLPDTYLSMNYHTIFMAEPESFQQIYVA